MKPIGITQRVTVGPHDEKRDALAHDWYAFLRALGRPWVALPNEAASATRLAETLGLAAIILTGGDDIGVFPERDYAELALLEWASAKNLPVIGVCRGFQFIWHWLGGELIEADPRLHLVKHHEIVMADGSRRVVNSFHKHALNESEHLMEPVAHSIADGALEAARKDTLLGLLWHPERESQPQTDDLELFNEHLLRYN